MWNNQGGFKGMHDMSGGGGGYMRAPMPGNFDSPNLSQGERSRTRREQTVFPVTIAFIHRTTAADDTIRIGEMEVQMMSIVGLVKSVAIQSTNITYVIDDLSGPPIEAKKWHNQDGVVEDDGTYNQPRENIYVRVIGSLRSFQGKRYLMVFDITTLASLNDLTTHLLEVIHSKLKMERGLPMNDGLGEMSNLQEDGMNYSFTGGPNEQLAIMNGMTMQQQTVYQTIQRCGDDTGIGVDALCAQLRSYTKETIGNALAFLSEEGHIYSTIDEDHYRATVS